MTDLQGPWLALEPFAVHVDDDALADVEDRIRRTRWPEPSPGVAWTQGMDLDYLRDLLAYWVDGFDWRAQEQELNQFDHFRANIDGLRIHFIHERARHGHGIPLILTHGWPSTFAEFLPLVPLLTDPGAHGIDGPAFDLVIPSLPGHGFSDKPQTPTTARDVAGMWHQLMGGLGYGRYGAEGGDIGESVATFMALDNPNPMIGIHLHTLLGSTYAGPESRPLSEAELNYMAVVEAWDNVERGYSAIQSTKPQTVGYGLNDSPAGLAAWILEKWRGWSDCGGDLDAHLSRDFLLTTVMLYWVTETITSSMRGYYDRRWNDVPLKPADFVQVPTAIAIFDNPLIPAGRPPHEWAERLYNVCVWTPMPSGAGFAPREEPERLARHIASFFGAL
jgi:pimeloyl-ACP methyl ester carboxylesterase